MVAVYKHRPLSESKEKPEIRLVELLGENPDEYAHIKIHSTPIDQAPPYVALSYCWRGQEADGVVFVHEECETDNEQGEIIYHQHVTANLLLGLQRILEAVFRTGKDHLQIPRFLWVDAICIDQTSPSEKSVQVPLMCRIYSSAMKTLIWLGEPTEPGLEALCAKLLKRTHGKEDKEFRFERSDNKAMMKTKYLHIKGIGTEEVTHLLTHPYFARVWIQQEVAVSKEVLILIGPCLLTWVALAHSAGAVPLLDMELMAPREYRWPGPRLVNVRRDWQRGVKFSHFELLVIMRNMGASIDRDHIYSLISLASDVDALAIVPDYTDAVSDADVFVDFASRVMLTHKTLRPLGASRALRHGEAEGRETLALPSWVPDWRVNPSSMSILDFCTAREFRAGGEDAPSIQITAESHLVLRGTFLDIAKVGNPVSAFLGQDASVEEWTFWKETMSENSIAKTFREWGFSEGDLYVTGGRMFDVFTSLMVLGEKQSEQEQKTFARAYDTPLLLKMTLLMQEHHEAPNLSWRRRGRTYASMVSLFAKGTMRLFFPKTLKWPFDEYYFVVGRRLALSECGAISIVPRTAEISDRVFFAQGCDFPLVLRPREDGTYVLLDAAYTHGFMHGGIWDSKYGTSVTEIELV